MAPQISHRVTTLRRPHHFCRDVNQHRLVEVQIRDDLLQFRVLVAQLPEFSRLATSLQIPSFQKVSG